MDIQSFLDMLAQGAVVLRQFVIALCSMVLGWWIITMACIKMLKWSDPRRQYGAPSIAARFVVGSLFANAADYLQMQVLTWTGQGMASDNAMSVMPAAGSSVPRMILGTLLAWVATVGVMAILKGTRLIIKAADGSGQGGSMHEDPGWTAFVYIVSGAIGVNLWRWVPV